MQSKNYEGRIVGLTYNIETETEQFYWVILFFIK